MSLDVIASLDRDNKWALLAWTRAGQDDVFGSGRDNEGIIMVRIVTLCSDKETEHGPDEGEAGVGPKLDGGSSYSVGGGLWTLDKVVARPKINGMEDLNDILE